MKQHQRNRIGVMTRIAMLRLFSVMMATGLFASGSAAAGISVIYPQDASFAETLAAREVRRYLYLRTGQLLPIIEADAAGSVGTAGIVVGRKDRPVVRRVARAAGIEAVVSALGDGHYLLRTVGQPDQRRVLVTGGDDVGTLYGAYRLAEHLGVRFYLHGDVVPERQMSLKLPIVDELARPLFALRGIQPFHDFPEGPDFWNLDDYKAILSQLPKLGMNFIGLHTYPEGGVGPEPTVWIGASEDVADDGSVTSSYPSRHFTTLNGTWGYKAKKTSDYSFGASALFERDDYGAEVMAGMTPWPATPQHCNDLFNRFGTVLRGAFEHAHALGIKTCVGTETPLRVPKVIKERLAAAGKDPTDGAVIQKLYEGMFRRIAKAYPIDYYWLWTTEKWTWKGATDAQVAAVQADLRAAIAAARETKAPFTLATCGWVLGPPQDRSLFDNELPKDMPMSCINRQVGKAPVEPGFADVTGRPKWAIPWMEDDPAMTVPQLWVGRMRRDAFDALRYGCTGLMGIHWRTRILGINVSALAKAAWDQSGWSNGAAQLAVAEEAALPRSLPSNDFYADWARSQFGADVAPLVAALFVRLDGRLPQPAEWVKGPGGMKPDSHPWKEVSKAYDFVTEFAGLRPVVEGKGHLERFDYWLNTFRYLESMAHVRCTWARYDEAMKKVEAEPDAGSKRELAGKTALPIRKELVKLVSQTYQYLLATVCTTGEMGTVVNWEQHILPTLLGEPGEKLAKILGKPLPADAIPTTNYEGPTRVIVPTTRTSLEAGEALKLKVIILTAEPVRETAALWRAMGTKKTFASRPLTHVARSVYTVHLTPEEIGEADIEYYIRVVIGKDEVVYFPATAPRMNQTVVVVPGLHSFTK